MKVWLTKSSYDPNGYLLFFRNPVEAPGQSCMIPWETAVVLAADSRQELPERKEKYISFLLEAKPCPHQD